MKNTWFPFLVLFACISLFIAAAQGQSFPTAGSIGTPITFNLEWGCISPNQFQSTTVFWDFGSGATPATATTDYIYDGVISAHCSQAVTYLTPGSKTFTLTTVSGGNSPFMDTFTVHIYDCSIPSIPHNAIVINRETTVAESHKAYWINPGGTLVVAGGEVGYDTIFAEPGSTISGVGVSGVGDCMIYMKQGSVLTSSWGENRVIFGDGAHINPSSSDFTLNCPTLDFDYSNAPPNAAHPTESVKNDLNSVSITLFPNPTTGMLSVQGLPSDNITVSIFNILGEMVMEQKNPPAPDFTLDLSKLVPGTYYIRFSSPNSVVTKKVIR